MIDLENEDVISMRDAASLVPYGRSERRRGVDVATVYRWAKKGLRGIRLEHAFCGGSLVTSRQALDRFFARITAQRSGEGEALKCTPERKTSKRMTRREEIVQSRLKELGV